MRASVPFIPDQRIESQAAALLARYNRRAGQIEMPVPIERVVEDVLGLNIVWDSIQGAGPAVLAGLEPVKRLVKFNDAARNFVEDTPGLYESILGHEAGHWVLHANQGSEFQERLRGLEGGHLCNYREVAAEHGFAEVQAHKFMGYVLLPTELLTPLVREKDLLTWSEVYGLRDACRVTISALVRRLERLNLLYVDDNGRLHRSRAEAEGQGVLF